jgi:hypothetical protein
MAKRKSLSPEVLSTALACVDAQIDLNVKSGEASIAELAPLFSAREALGNLGAVETESGGAPKRRTRKAASGAARALEEPRTEA